MASRGSETRSSHTLRAPKVDAATITPKPIGATTSWWTCSPDDWAEQCADANKRMQGASLNVNSYAKVKEAGE